MKVIGPDGKVIEVPNEEVQARYQKGEIKFIKGTKIPTKTPDGLFLTPAEEADQAFANKAVVAPEEEYRAAAQHAKYGTLGHYAAAGAEALVSGATLGGSDWAAIQAAKAFGGRKSAQAVREHLRAEHEEHPYLTAAGQIAGATIPALLSGGASEAESAGAATRAIATLGAPARALSAAGRFAEGLVPEIGEGMAARMATAGLRYGAAGAVETAGFSAANQINEDVLGDHKLSAEKIMAAMGHGAVMGGLFGAGLGVGGEAASAATKAASRFVSPMVKRLAEEQAVRSLFLSADRTAMRRIQRLEGGVAGLGRELHESDLIRFGDTVESIQPRVQDAQRAAGREVGHMYKDLDARGFRGPSVKVLAEGLEREIMARGGSEFGPGRLEMMPATNRAAIRQAKNLVSDFGLAMGGLDKQASFEGLHTFRRFLDDKINWNPKRGGMPLNIPQDSLKAARQYIQSELEKSGESAMRSVGGSFRPELKRANLRYARLSEARDAVDEAVARKAVNRGISPSDYGIGIGTAAGAIAAGHPVTALGGIATSLAHKVIRERGNATTAVLLDKLANLGSLSKQIAKFDGEVDSSIAAFGKRISAKEKPRVKLRTGAVDKEQLKDRYEKEIERVQAAQHINQDVALRSLQKLSRHAPNVMPALAIAAQTAAAWLASKIPSSHTEQSMTPHLDMPRTTDFEKTKFLKYADAVEKGPIKLAQEIADGHVNRETVEANKALYPEAFKETGQKLLSAIADKMIKPPYDERIQLGIWFEVPTDGSLQPSFISQRQAMFAPKPQPQQGPAQPQSKPINTDKTAEAMRLPLSAGA